MRYFIRNRPVSAPAAFLGACMLLSTLSLSSCGTEESDGSAPEVTLNLAEREGVVRLGITDTIKIDFSEPIDTATLEVEFLPEDIAAGIARHFEGKRKMLVYGTHKNFGRTHFAVGKPFAVALTHLSDLDGNHRDRIQWDFEPYHWSDVDFYDRNREGEIDTLFGSSHRWRLAVDTGDTLWTEGKLDVLTAGPSVDLRDAKLLRLHPLDTLSLLLESGKEMDINVDLIGPFPEEAFDSLYYSTNPKAPVFSDSTRNKGRVAFPDFVPGLDRHRNDLGPGNAESTGLYVIRLNMFKAASGFYRLRVVHKRESH